MPRQILYFYTDCSNKKTKHSEILTNLIEGMLFAQNIDDTTPHILPLKEIAILFRIPEMKLIEWVILIYLY